MNYTNTRRLCLKGFLGFLSLTALVGIFAVLNRKFGETQLKVLITTFSISAGSICAMSCAGFLERKGAKWIGLAGIVAATIAVLLVICGAWIEVTEDNFWRTAFTFIVVAVALAHVCLLHLPKLAVSYRWTQTLSSILIGLLAIQIALAMWNDIKDENFYRWMAALSILVVLGTLAVPICNKLSGRTGDVSEGGVHEDSPEVPERLVLSRVSGVVFSDETGRTYQVIEIGAESGAKSKADSANASPASMS